MDQAPRSEARRLGSSIVKGQYEGKREGETSVRRFVLCLRAEFDLQQPLSDPEERLPKVTYTVYKDRQLKDVLSNLGLSTAGNRAAWINRHTR